MMERHHKMEHIQRDHFMLPKLAWKSDELRMEQSVFGIKVRVLLCEGWVCTAMYVCALCFAREAAVSVAACLTPLCVSIFDAPTAQHIHRTQHTQHTHPPYLLPPRSFLKHLRWRRSMRRTPLFTTISWEASMATMGASMGEGAGHGHTGSSSSEKGWQAMKRV